MKRFPLAALAALVTCAAVADEGMWTFDNPPRAVIQSTYGVDLDEAWLNRVREGTVRLDGGCTGSFISGEGLILTNHHCAEACIADNSTPDSDLNTNGFLAATREKEPRCGDDSISRAGRHRRRHRRGHQGDGRRRGRRRGRSAPQRADAARAGLRGSLEEQRAAALKCERVTLYQGGQYWLYKYKRYEDVRLVFAPEKDIAAFGGDPDNFQFPRWCLDMSILRAYENGKPAEDAEPPAHQLGRRRSRRPGVRGRPSRQHRPPADGGAARDPAHDLHAVLADALLGTARPHAPVLEDGRGTAAHGRGLPEPDRERDQGAPQAVRRAARPGADRRGRRRRKRRCAPRSPRSASSRARRRPGTTSRRRSSPGATSWCRTPSSRAARPSTASCSCHARTLVRARRRARQAERVAARGFTEARLPRVKQGLEAPKPDLPGVRDPAPVVRPRAHARMARPGSPARAPGVRQRLARHARRRAWCATASSRIRPRASPCTRAARPRSRRARIR